MGWSDKHPNRIVRAKIFSDGIVPCPTLLALCESKSSEPVFCLLLRVSSGYAQPITGQITEVTCPVIGQALPELALSKRWKTGPEHRQILLTRAYIEELWCFLCCWLEHHAHVTLLWWLFWFGDMSLRHTGSHCPNYQIQHYGNMINSNSRYIYIYIYIYISNIIWTLTPSQNWINIASM